MKLLLMPIPTAKNMGKKPMPMAEKREMWGGRKLAKKSAILYWRYFMNNSFLVQDSWPELVICEYGGNSSSIYTFCVS